MKQPVSRHLLDIAIDRLADKYGDPIRIRRMMANTIICQMLPEGVCVKGGSALKFRFGDAATRFTRDLDIARSVDLVICVKEIDSALRKGWNGFTGVLVPGRKANPADVPPQYVMEPFAAKLAYYHKPWLTVELEIGHNEIGDADAFDEGMPDQVRDIFAELGLPTPRPVRLMSVSHQVAQKLHALTAPRSKRAHDLLDLQLIAANSQMDLPEILKVCRRLFGYRKMQTWPPTLQSGTDWAERYDAQKTGLPVLPSVDEAVAWANDLIQRIDDAEA